MRHSLPYDTTREIMGMQERAESTAESPHHFTQIDLGHCPHISLINPHISIPNLTTGLDPAPSRATLRYRRSWLPFKAM